MCRSAGVLTFDSACDKAGADELGYSGRAYDSDHFNMPKEITEKTQGLTPNLSNEVTGKIQATEQRLVL